jgi:hypothetical protein
MAQVTAPWDRPLLTVRDRQLPVLRARGGHGRRGPIALQHGGDGHKLNWRVRPVHVDHLPRWQGAAGARQLCELVRVRGLGRAAATCGARGSVSWTDEGPAMTVVVRCGLLAHDSDVALWSPLQEGNAEGDGPSLGGRVEARPPRMAAVGYRRTEQRSGPVPVKTW